MKDNEKSYYENLVLLEYHKESGYFLESNVVEGKVRDKAPTSRLEPIAVTTQAKSDIFCLMISSKINRRKATKRGTYSTEFVRKEWKHFSYVFNAVIKGFLDGELETHKDFILKGYFDDAKELARLGCEHFSDKRIDEELDWACEYNPLDFVDSNF